MVKNTRKRKMKPRARRTRTKQIGARASKPQINPVNKSQYIILKYSDGYFGTTGIVPSLATIQIKLNSLYDPQGSLGAVNNSQGTVGGHQPYGYDQLGILYDYVHVYKVKAIIKCMHSNYTATVVSDTGTSATIPSNFTLQCERPGCHKVVTSGNGDCRTITRTYNIPKILGITLNEYLGDDKYGLNPNVAADPAVLVYGSIMSQALDLSSHNAHYFVDLHFYCKFRGKRLLPQS